MPEHDGGGAMLAFAGFYPLPDDGLIGAAMVTNERGYPQEFRASMPVRLSQLQKLLYGYTREAYLMANVIGPPLLEALGTPFEFAVVNRYEALDIPWDAPLAFYDPDGDLPVGEDRFQVEHLTIEGDDVVVSTKGEIPTEVLRVVWGVNPQDVFARMKSALDTLAGQDERYR